MYGNMTNVEK